MADQKYQDSRPTIPAEVRRAIELESGHACAISRCGEHTYLELHHINANRDDNCSENLILLCDNHHKMAHSGVIDRKALREYKLQLRERTTLAVTHMGSSVASDTAITQSGRVTSDEPPMDVIQQRCATSEALFKTAEPSVVVRLPRGFILMDSLTSDCPQSWSVVLHYYDFDRGWRYGTHYHTSYRRHWSLQGNASKMGLPDADCRHAFPALDMAMTIRDEVLSLDRIRDLVASQSDAKFLETGEEITHVSLPSVISGGPPWTRHSKLRDIEFEMNQLLDETPDRCTHEVARELRLRALTELQRIIPKGSLGLEHVQEVATEYRGDMQPAELVSWLAMLQRILRTAIELQESS